MSPIVRAVVAVHLATIMFDGRHPATARELLTKTRRALAAMRTRNP